jgi:hypothetical protein
MCNRPDFEAMERYVNETLTTLFTEWYFFQREFLDDEELHEMDFVEEFKKDICQRLVALKDIPKVQEINQAKRKIA